MPVEFDVSVDSGDIDKLVEQGLEAISIATKYAAADLWGNIRAEAPVDEGRLAGGFELQQMDDLTWNIFTNVSYALMVYEGTQPHIIEPSGAGALRFEADGGVVFAKRVHHPGTVADPYIDRAEDATSARIDDFISIALREVGVA